MDIQLTYNRRQTTTTKVGNIEIGSEYPVRIQTMANTSTNDIEGSVAQAERCIEAGAELLRFTTQGLREVESLSLIHHRLIASSPYHPISRRRAFPIRCGRCRSQGS